MGKMIMETILGRVGLMPQRQTTKQQTLVSASSDAYGTGTTEIGVLTFEIASLMSKIVRLHQSLGEDQISQLSRVAIDQPGVRKLVSDDKNYLLCLALSEMLESFAFLARSTARLGRKCSDPVLRRFDHAVSDLIATGEDPFRLEYSGRKKVERKVKKMERFISASVSLYQEMEVLAELELVFKKLKQRQRDAPSSSSSTTTAAAAAAAAAAATSACLNGGVDQGNLSSFKQKVVWQRQEVKNLKEASLWNRSFDYTVRLLARSLFSVGTRIKQVFAMQNVESHRAGEIGDNSMVLVSKSGRIPSANSTSGFMPRDSGISKSGPIPRMNEVISNGRQCRKQRWSPVIRSVKSFGSKTKWPIHAGPFTGCIADGENSQVLQSCVSSDTNLRRSNAWESKANRCVILHPQLDCKILSKDLCSSLFEPRHKLLVPPPSTLGASALELHYANVIVVIEKLVASPHLIGPDARDDLYNMLPSSIRSELRIKLRLYAKNLTASVYDPVLASEWSAALVRILEWLVPLARNMIRWQAERNYEQQHLFSKTNVLLLQTLYFANQTKTEAAITELLIGLNYLWRYGRELHAKALMETMSCGSFDDQPGSKP